MICTKCKVSAKIIRFGTMMTSEGRKQRYQCQNCGYISLGEIIVDNKM